MTTILPTQESLIEWKHQHAATLLKLFPNVDILLCGRCVRSKVDNRLIFHNDKYDVMVIETKSYSGEKRDQLRRLLLTSLCDTFGTSTIDDGTIRVCILIGSNQNVTIGDALSTV